MEKLVTYVEQTIPILTAKYWTLSQSRDSLYSSNQSDQSLNITSESDETISTSSYYTGVDQESLDLEKEHQVFSEALEGELEDQSQLQHQGKQSALEGMAVEVSGWKSASEYHRELPCLKIIVDDFDKQKVGNKKYSISPSSKQPIESAEINGEFCKGQNISEQHIQDYEQKLLSVSNGLNMEGELACHSLEHSCRIPGNNTANADDDTEPKQTTLTSNDLEKLKLLANRLKLQTRRGSYTTWKDKLVQAMEISSTSSRESSHNLCNGVDGSGHSVVCGDLHHGGSTSSRVQEKLDYIRNELQSMRDQDVALARQFMSLRNDIQQMRLQHSSWAVEDMVDAAQWSIAETTELKHVCDEPRSIDKTPLLTVGVTKMNLTERRFSVF